MSTVSLTFCFGSYSAESRYSAVYADGCGTSEADRAFRWCVHVHIALYEELVLSLFTGTTKVLADTPPAGLIPELQLHRCMSSRYKHEQFPRCVSCTRRWAGDTCRFQGIRFFLKDQKGTIVGVSFVENQKPDAPNMNFPTTWNTRLEESHIRETKVRHLLLRFDDVVRLRVTLTSCDCFMAKQITVARALLPILQKELEHLNSPEIIRRPRESDVRATCGMCLFVSSHSSSFAQQSLIYMIDTCMTSIFSSSWMCRLCGRETCAECFEKVRELTQPRPDATQHELAALQARRESHAVTNPFFLTCTRRNEHAYKDFSAVSRFHRTELAGTIKEMKQLLKEVEDKANKADAEGDVSMKGADAGENTGNGKAAEVHADSGSTEVVEQAGGSASVAPVVPVQLTTSEPAATSTQSAPLIPPPVDDPQAGTDDIPCYPTHRFTDGELTEELFRAVWSQGIPLMVTGLLDKFELKWTPEYFMDKYASQTCSIVECQTEQIKRMTVGEFFKMFGKYEGREMVCAQSGKGKEGQTNGKATNGSEKTNGKTNANGNKKKEEAVWKLKDWPPSMDFKTAFPELYEDFERAVPMPKYCRRDGALNIASHFPANAVAPDLGALFPCSHFCVSCTK